MTNHDILRVAREQSAIDMNCVCEDFHSSHSRVVVSELRNGRKKYFTKTHFCQLASFGTAVVASVDMRIVDFMTSFLAKHDGFHCLDMPQINSLNDEFSQYGKHIGLLSEYFLPDISANREVHPDFDVEILFKDEITRLYDDDRFHMALSYTDAGDKHDVIAVAGYYGNQLIGVAGASNDCDTMWQVGIDVLPEYRNQGVASILVKSITAEILKLNIVPFYGAAWSNIASKNTAIRCGYKSAWIEAAALDISE